MTTSTLTRYHLLQDRRTRMSAGLLTDSEQPLDAVMDFSICEGRQPGMQESAIHQDRPPLAEAAREPESLSPIDDPLASNHPQSTKQLRQALGVAAHVSLEYHGWKKTGKTSSFWTFEHRWPHQRDRAEGRNHRLQSN